MKRIKLFIILNLLAIFILSIINQPVILALSAEQKKVFQSGIYYFDTEASGQALGGGMASTCLTAQSPGINDQAALADVINNYIISNGGKGSPFDGLGNEIIIGAQKSGVNPLIITALAQKESSFGTKIPPKSFNAFGRTAGSGQPSVETNGRSWYKWNSWELSVNGPSDISTLLKSVYIDQGLTSVEDVINKYAPAADSNNPVNYAEQVKSWMNSMLQLAGNSLACGTSEQGPSSPTGNAAIGKQLAASYGWAEGEQWGCLFKLWTGESGWNEKADNPSSDAYGIPQALPGDKMSSEGADWKTNPATQINWGLKYIKGRYGSACNALAFWQSNNPHWY